METPKPKSLPEEAPSRPQIGDFEEPSQFIKEMIAYRKATDKKFSVYTATASLRKISPALVSLVAAGKRKVTLDRLEEFAKLLQLNPREKTYFKSWLQRLENGVQGPTTESGSRNRKEIGIHILNDWINVYVKDCFQLAAVQKNPKLIYQYLSSYANPARIDKSIEFLLREGYLRRTLDGQIVVEADLVVANSELPSRKIRQFHKGALGVAKVALDLFPTSERMANTLILPLNKKRYEELVEMIGEFSEKLQDFAAQEKEPGDRLYQILVNLSPTGGKAE